MGERRVHTGEDLLADHGERILALERSRTTPTGTGGGGGPHTHVASDITDFNETVRDVVGAALVAGAGITVTVDDASNTITITSTGGGLDAESVRDTIGTALVAGTGISITVNDAGDTITITSTVTSLDAEAVRDTIGSALVAGTGITITVNDAGDTITIAAAAPTGEAAVNTVAATGSTETLSAAYQMHKVTMDANCVFTFTSPTAGAVFAVLLSGAFVPTWPATVKWPDATLPTYTAPALYVFATFDGGTTWDGVQSGKAFG